VFGTTSQYSNMYHDDGCVKDAVAAYLRRQHGDDPIAAAARRHLRLTHQWCGLSRGHIAMLHMGLDLRSRGGRDAGVRPSLHDLYRVLQPALQHVAAEQGLQHSLAPDEYLIFTALSAWGCLAPRTTERRPCVTAVYFATHDAIHPIEFDTWEGDRHFVLQQQQGMRRTTLREAVEQALALPLKCKPPLFIRKVSDRMPPTDKHQLLKAIGSVQA
jgi:hypothetical protein